MDSWNQISGAKVEVHDPCPGSNEGKVVVSGTPDQTMAAQSASSFHPTGPNYVDNQRLNIYHFNLWSSE